MFEDLVKKALEWLKEYLIPCEEVHYLYAAYVLGVSPNYARQVLKAVALISGGKYVYERGKIRRIEGCKELGERKT